MSKQIKTSKRAYPDGRVPVDFKNWLLKIKNIYLDEMELDTEHVRYVGAFPFRKGVNYKARPMTILDQNFNRIQTTKLIRLT